MRVQNAKPSSAIGDLLGISKIKSAASTLKKTLFSTSKGSDCGGNNSPSSSSSVDGRSADKGTQEKTLTEKPCLDTLVTAKERLRLDAFKRGKYVTTTSALKIQPLSNTETFVAKSLNEFLQRCISNESRNGFAQQNAQVNVLGAEVTVLLAFSVK